MFINIKGNLINYSQPLIMGIMNITPDSFFYGSRKQTEKEIIERISQLQSEGADIIDIGGYSSRPNAVFVSEEEELSRLELALKIFYTEFPDLIVSIDTFRSEIALRCVEKYGVSIINDISAGQIDPQMFDVIARLNVPYVIMHMKGTPQTMTQYTNYDNLQQEIFLYFAEKIEKLIQKGVNDIIIDPGFGFSKTIDQNYALMNCLEDFIIFERPLLVGISRKSMIGKVLNCSSEDCLNGTTILNTLALVKGANILRVHNVKEAVQVIQLVNKTKESSL